MLMLDKVRVLAEEFDILHFHIDQYHFPLFREMAGRTVTTLHGRQELPDLKRSISALARCRWSRSPMTCASRKSYPRVAMMQPGQNRHSDNRPIWLDRST
jgi:hypothetical protein